MKELFLDGSSLNISDLKKFLSNPDARVSVSEKVLEKIKKSRSFLDDNMNEKIIYGVNTGFGPMASHIVGNKELLDLQVNLIRSHASGMGEPIANEYVLGAMVVRLNTVLKGNSGVSVELVNYFVEFINNRIIPIIPEHGAVGTSGDLVQLAHIALALIGEGQVFYQGKIQSTSEVMKLVSIEPYKLKPKEGLALINGTSVMTAIAACVCIEAEELVGISIKTSAWALELINGYDDAVSETLHKLRPHRGQNYVAKTMREILSSSSLLQKRESLVDKYKDLDGKVSKIKDDVQNVYSFRCVPQILGPVYDTYLNTKSVVEIEMNSVTDNPVIDLEEERFIHGGNFHGDYIASVIDQLKMVLVKLTMLSERRINFFLDEKVNGRFSPFLNMNQPGLTLALQGMQFVATSTTAKSQTLAYPQYVHSISTNGSNQDVVSMGTDAALICAEVLEHGFNVLIIEMLTLAQCFDLSADGGLSDSSNELYEKVRKVSAPVVEDRSLHSELQELVANFRFKSNLIRVN